MSAFSKLSKLWLLAITPLFATDLRVSEVLGNYDGDTFKVNIENVHPLLGSAISIRIMGIDCPELKSNHPRLKELAIRAKEFTKQALEEADEITLVNVKRGKYFRIVAEVWIDGVNLGELLLQEGLAKPYDGGKKPSWEFEDEQLYTYF